MFKRPQTYRMPCIVEPLRIWTVDGVSCSREADGAGMWGLVTCNWPRGVTVSTLDSESSNRGSNPREAFFLMWLHL